MKITKNNLEKAVSANIITADQLERLLASLKTLPSAGPRFDFTHILYYMGGLVVIGAMTLFMKPGLGALRRMGHIRHCPGVCGGGSQADALFPGPGAHHPGGRLRRVFVVFGAIGVSVYLGHLANEVFQDSWLFPFALTAIGLGIIYLGLACQKNEARITRRVRSCLPTALRDFLEEKRF